MQLWYSLLTCFKYIYKFRYLSHLSASHSRLIPSVKCGSGEEIMHID